MGNEFQTLGAEDRKAREVENPYPCAKFYHYAIKGFRSPPRPLPRSVVRV